MPRERKGRRRGMTLVEIMVAFLVMVMTALGALTMFPVSTVMQDRSGSDTRAAAILQRKLEQIRDMDPKLLSYAGLKGAAVIDPDNPEPVDGRNATMTFTQVEEMGKELAQGAGTVTLSADDDDLTRVDVTVSWRAMRGRQIQVTGTTFISSREVWREQ